MVKQCCKHLMSWAMNISASILPICCIQLTKKQTILIFQEYVATKMTEGLLEFNALYRTYLQESFTLWNHLDIDSLRFRISHSQVLQYFQSNKIMLICFLCFTKVS